MAALRDLVTDEGEQAELERLEVTERPVALHGKSCEPVNSLLAKHAILSISAENFYS